MLSLAKTLTKFDVDKSGVCSKDESHEALLHICIWSSGIVKKYK
jgi:hypothetical protein